MINIQNLIVSFYVNKHSYTSTPTFNLLLLITFIQILTPFFNISRYSQVAREVLPENIPSCAYDVLKLLCNMVALLYNKSVQSSGWSNADVEALETVAWTHAVAAKEYYALHICTNNLEYSTHFCDDLKHHSSPDNCSCEVFECPICVHKQQTHKGY